MLFGSKVWNLETLTFVFIIAHFYYYVSAMDGCDNSEHWRCGDICMWVLTMYLFLNIQAWEQKSGVILTSMEPNIFRILFSIKNKKLWCCKPLVPLVGQKTCALHEILTQLVSTENAWKDLQHHNFLFLMENGILKIFGSVDVKITLDFVYFFVSVSKSRFWVPLVTNVSTIYLCTCNLKKE